MMKSTVINKKAKETKNGKYFHNHWPTKRANRQSFKGGTRLGTRLVPHVPIMEDQCLFYGLNRPSLNEEGAENKQ